jgi:hypothetical protein
MENRKIFSVRKNCVWKTQIDFSYADFACGNDKSILHTQFGLREKNVLSNKSLVLKTKI